jgi:hypothetical protein
MKRALTPEILDQLPANDPRAIQSRRDLRRINGIMGNARLLSRFLARQTFTAPITLVELGAGDGNIALRVARDLQAHGARGTILLIDREPATAEAPALEGWKIEIIRADVFDWLASAPSVDIIIANLFLHHFETQPLQTLLRACAARCRSFAAAEPRRNACAETFARLVGLIGCNDVTRHDAVVSVRAGFNDRELSRLWPTEHWTLRENRAGLFTHVFTANHGP